MILDCGMPFLATSLYLQNDWSCPQCVLKHRTPESRVRKRAVKGAFPLELYSGYDNRGSMIVYTEYNSEDDSETQCCCRSPDETKESP